MNARYKMIPKTYDREKILKYYDTDNTEELAFLQDTFQVKIGWPYSRIHSR